MRIGLSREIPGVLACALLCGPACAQEAMPRLEPAACPFEGAEGREDVRCSFLVVPENRDAPSGKTLRLAVAVLKSTGTEARPDPLVFLSGGPGGPSVENTIARLSSPFWNRYRATRDLVFYDQRGTGFSDPKFCKEMSFDLITATFRGLSATDRNAFVVDAVNACRKKMLAQGIDFAYYNTVTSARDLEDLRKALGHEQWNLFGGSYGTRLALTAVRDAPAGIRSVVLDSTWPPNAPIADSKARLARSLNLAFEQCAADANCRSAYPALRQDFFSALKDFEANPMILEMGDRDRFPDGRIIVDGNLLAWGVFQGFYDEGFVKVFPLVVRELGARNEDVLIALADGLVQELSVSLGLQYAVECYDWITRVNPELAAADASRHPELEVWQAYADEQEVCKAWHGHRADDSALQAVHSEIPVLIFAGEFDPITPPAFGRLAAETLPNSTLIEAPATGHGVVPYSDCTMKVMEDFLARPSETLDTSCVAAIAPIRFTTDVYMNPGIYRLAKQLEGPSTIRMLGAGAVLLLLLSAVVSWPLAGLVRRIRRRSLSMPAGARNARWLAALTSMVGLAFVVAVGAVIAMTVEDNPYLLGFGVPGSARPLFILPWLLMLGTGGVVVLAVVAWRRGWWTLAGRLHYSFIACACVALIAGIASSGLL
jgi:pimeloyl-ACP methyl ester carboxylesterase